MYRLVECEDVVRVPPSLFGKPLKEVVLEVLRNEYSGRIIRSVGVVVDVLDAEASEYGVLVPGDGSLHHRVRFSVLVYSPQLQEVIEGEVTVVESTGILVRLGPIEGYVHKSQILDETVSYSREQNTFISQKGRVLRRGDTVRARVVAVSYDNRRHVLRVQLTMRQPYLGKLDWLKEEAKKSAEAAEKKAAPPPAGAGHTPPHPRALSGASKS